MENALAALITAEPAQGTAGTKVTVRGTAWPPGDLINLSWNFQPFDIVASVQADGNGAFTTPITVPQGAPIGPTYVDSFTERVTEQAPFTVIPPQCCVGAVGPMCGGIFDRGTKCGDAPGGIKSVSVGSILHDNCCILKYPDGDNCNNGGNNNVCGDEFKKAVKNFKKREWKAYFSGDPDNISPVPARISNPMNFPETVATSRLSAPAGTKLNKTDVDYCQSKSFIEAQEQLAKQNFGTCGGDPWIGEWVQVNFLTIYDDGVWGEDILSGIGFVAKIRATKWKETDEHGEGRAVTFSYTINNEKVYSKKAIKLGERCPPLPLPLLSETGKLEFSKNDLFMFEYFDLQPGDEIAAFKWMRR